MQLLQNFRRFCRGIYQHTISGLGTGDYVTISVAIRIAGSTEGSQCTPIDLNVHIFYNTCHAILLGTTSPPPSRLSGTEPPLLARRAR
jgi:hypothetical protein